MNIIQTKDPKFSLRFATPDDAGLVVSFMKKRHAGQSARILRQREQVYAAAKSRHPERWSGPTRNWELKDEVWLNPERLESETVRRAA